MGHVFFGVPHEQDDGTDASGKQVAFHLVDAAQLLRDLHIAHHDGERLIASAFSAAQFAHGLLGIGAAGEVKTAQAFDCHNAIGGEDLGATRDDGIACLERIAHCGLVIFAFAPCDVGTAHKAGIRLRVKAPVKGAAVLVGAVGAHGKSAHGGLDAIVGQVANDGKARSAVGAVDEGVMVASVCGIEELT